jgi:hypothetical protein
MAVLVALPMVIMTIPFLAVFFKQFVWIVGVISGISLSSYVSKKKRFDYMKSAVRMAFYSESLWLHGNTIKSLFFQTMIGEKPYVSSNGIKVPIKQSHYLLPIVKNKHYEIVKLYASICLLVLCCFLFVGFALDSVMLNQSKLFFSYYSLYVAMALTLYIARRERSPHLRTKILIHRGKKLSLRNWLIEKARVYFDKKFDTIEYLHSNALSERSLIEKIKESLVSKLKNVFVKDFVPNPYLSEGSSHVVASELHDISLDKNVYLIIKTTRNESNIYNKNAMYFLIQKTSIGQKNIEYDLQDVKNKKILDLIDCEYGIKSNCS